MTFDLFGLIILPIMIFSFRIIDVTLGTIRIIFVSQGRRNIAPILGFFEILIWLLAVSQIFSNITNILYYIAYAGGFATGNYIGMYIEDKIAMGLYILRIILKEENYKLFHILHQNGYGLASLDAKGSDRSIKIVILIIRRKNFEKIKKVIENYDNDVFISVEHVHSINDGLYPAPLKTRRRFMQRKRNFR